MEVWRFATISIPNGVIALLTDFGDRDGFAGVLKGVILSLYPEARLVDIAHDIPGHDIRHASWVLDQAFDYFPQGTFFLSVVDPLVGSKVQKDLAIFYKEVQKALILPDNGLASRILNRYPEADCYVIQNESFYGHNRPTSQTFHGRDIYAPVAARLAKAFSAQAHLQLLSALGPRIPVQELIRLNLIPAEKKDAGQLQGQVDIIDTYGNVITNIPYDWLDEMPSQKFQIILSDRQYQIVLANSYGELADTLMLIPGSHGMIELACFGSSAQLLLQAKPGQELSIVPI